MSESDRLRAMLDERGIEHHDYDKGGRTQTLWEAPDMERYFCFETEANPAKTSRLTISWFPTAEQAIAATLGSDRLTAEQVQHAIERHFGKVAVLDDGGPVEWRDDWVCKVGIDYRGIADELNALLGVTARQDEQIAALEALVRDMFDAMHGCQEYGDCEWCIDHGKSGTCPFDERVFKERMSELGVME